MTFAETSFWTSFGPRNLVSQPGCNSSLWMEILVIICPEKGRDSSAIVAMILYIAQNILWQIYAASFKRFWAPTGPQPRIPLEPLPIHQIAPLVCFLPQKVVLSEVALPPGGKYTRLGMMTCTIYHQARRRHEVNFWGSFTPRSTIEQANQ